MKTPMWMTTKTIKTLKFIGIGSILIVLLYQVGTRLTSRINEYQTTRAEAICPSLLSIGRSARDTLIVMKAEPLCNAYVLDRLM